MQQKIEMNLYQGPAIALMLVPEIGKMLRRQYDS